MATRHDVRVVCQGNERRETVTLEHNKKTSLEWTFGGSQAAVRCDLPGNTIYVDGRPAGSDLVQVWLNEGSHTVTCKVPGYSDANRTVRAATGVSINETLTPYKEPGTLVVTCVPGDASITVGGVLKPRAENGAVTVMLPPGTYEVTCVKPGYQSDSATASVEPRTTTSKSLVVEKSSEFFIDIGVGGAGYMKGPDKGAFGVVLDLGLRILSRVRIGVAGRLSFVPTKGAPDKTADTSDVRIDGHVLGLLGVAIVKGRSFGWTLDGLAGYAFTEERCVAWDGTSSDAKCTQHEDVPNSAAVGLQSALSIPISRYHMYLGPSLLWSADSGSAIGGELGMRF